MSELDVVSFFQIALSGASIYLVLVMYHQTKRTRKQYEELIGSLQKLHNQEIKILTTRITQLKDELDKVLK